MGLKVLVAENDAATLELMREVCSLHGVSVRIIDDGRRAADVINQEKFDAVFTELAMPALDGLTLIRQIRESSWNPRTPVVILSTQGDTPTRMQAFEAGGTFFLEKPVDRACLDRLLKSTRGAMVEERRRSMRIPFRTEVACLIGGHEISGISCNLSRDGILFQGDGSLKRGRLVQLTFRLERHRPAIRARGVVVRLDENQQAGVRLVPVDSDDGQRLRDFVAKNVDAL